MRLQTRLATFSSGADATHVLLLCQVPGAWYTPLHCMLLHCLLHAIALHTARHCTTCCKPLHCMLYGAASHATRHCTACCTPLHYMLHATALHATGYCTACYTPLHCKLHCTACITSCTACCTPATALHAARYCTAWLLLHTTVLHCEVHVERHYCRIIKCTERTLYRVSHKKVNQNLNQYNSKTNAGILVQLQLFFVKKIGLSIVKI